MVRRTGHRAMMAGVAAVALVFPIAACSSSTSPKGNSSSLPNTSSASLSGTGSSAASGGPEELATWVPTQKGKASGTPYTVGLLMDVNPLYANIAQYEAGAKAAIAYINNDLGGINGHPIKTAECKTGTAGQTAPTATCAQQIAAQKPIMVIGFAIVYGLAGAPIMQAHQIPTAMVAALPQDFQNSDNFSPGGDNIPMAPGIGYYAAHFLHAKTLIQLVNTNALAKPTEDLLKVGAGPDVKVSSVLAPATNMGLPSIIQATQAKPDALDVAIGAGPAAVTILKQIAAQGYPSDQLVANDGAIDGPTQQQAGSAYDGMGFPFGYLPWTLTSNPQVAAYLQAYKKYGNSSSTDESTWTERGFAAAIEVWEAASKVSGDVTGPNLLSYLKTASVPGFLSHGLDAKSVSGYAGIRDPYVFFVRAEHGTLVPVTGTWTGIPALLSK